MEGVPAHLVQGCIPSRDIDPAGQAIESQYVFSEPLLVVEVEDWASKKSELMLGPHISSGMPVNLFPSM
jgi:hypothetical protein